MTTALTIVARIEAKPGQWAPVKQALLKLIAPTRAEQGCLQYDLHQDNVNPDVFIFFERWTDRTLWQAHMSNDHLKAYMRETEGLVQSFTLNEMSQC